MVSLVPVTRGALSFPIPLVPDVDGVKTSNFCPRVSLAASSVSMAVAATALTYGGHLVATVASFLEKYATS